MAQIKINDITPSQLVAGVYQQQLPEYYLLQEKTENSLWHSNHNVLEHCNQVFTALYEELTTLESAQFISNALHEQRGNQSRKNILLFATLLHDIAKIDTDVHYPYGTVMYPGHDVLGASRIDQFAERFRFDDVSLSFARSIVLYHGFISTMLSAMIDSDRDEHYYSLIKEVAGDETLELVLFMRADLRGSDLKKNDREAFESRMEKLDWLMEQCAQEKPE